MRYIYSLLAALLLSFSPASASSYLALSFGTSFEHHTFDVWNGPATAGRRALTAQAQSSDYAVAIGFRDAFQIGNRPFDVDLEVFERMNSDFTATGPAGSHPTTIRTTSMLASIWTRVGGGDKWAVHAGAGVGARHSTYAMSGPGIGFRTSDRAPYAMVGLRLSKHAGKRTTLFTEIRAHTRPPVHSSGTAALRTFPLEHNSHGITLRMGLQITLGR
ncbi:MAG: hypothetical protein L3J30_06745 [Marinosulfonomonas sp.]|nr:hypothetical protein [Marinosulfonomonas sp.]